MTEIEELRAELDALKTALDRAFRSVGADWHFKRPTISVTEIAAQLNQAEPVPQSAVPNADDIRQMKKEIFGTTDLTLTPGEIALVNESRHGAGE